MLDRAIGSWADFEDQAPKALDDFGERFQFLFDLFDGSPFMIDRARMGAERYLGGFTRRLMVAWIRAVWAARKGIYWKTRWRLERLSAAKRR